MKSSIIRMGEGVKRERRGRNNMADYIYSLYDVADYHYWNPSTPIKPPIYSSR
jgi:hypothetical protein